MKRVLTLISLLVCFSAIGQESGNKKSQWIVSGSKIFNGAVSFSDSYHQIAHIKSSGLDTLIIDYPILVDQKHLFKYIKVGDKLFQEVEPDRGFIINRFGWGTLTPNNIQLTPFTIATDSTGILRSLEIEKSAKKAAKEVDKKYGLTKE